MFGDGCYRSNRLGLERGESYSIKSCDTHDQIEHHPPTAHPASRFEDLQSNSRRSLDASVSATSKDTGDAAGGVGVAEGVNRPGKPPRFDAHRFEMSAEAAAQARSELATPNSAAGSRFPDSPSSHAGSRLVASPTGEGAGNLFSTVVP